MKEVRWLVMMLTLLGCNDSGAATDRNDRADGDDGATTADNDAATTAGNDAATTAGNDGATTAGNDAATTADNDAATTAGNDGDGGVDGGSGTLPPGAPCYADDDCAPAVGGGALCSFRLCVQHVRAGAGNACTTTCVGPDECWTDITDGSPTVEKRCYADDNLYCHGTDATCQKSPSKQGDPCGNGANCPDGLFCDYHDFSAPSCERLRAPGESCADQFGDGPCAGYCGDDEKCHATIAPGGACVDVPFQEQCGLNASCVDGKCHE